MVHTLPNTKSSLHPFTGRKGFFRRENGSLGISAIFRGSILSNIPANESAIDKASDKLNVGATEAIVLSDSAQPQK